MGNTYFVYAFDTDDFSEVEKSVQIVTEILPKDCRVLFGTICDSEVQKSNVTKFPEDFSRAKMLNTMISELPSDATIVVSNGLSVPSFDGTDFSVMQDLSSNTFVSFPTRVPIVPPYLEDEQLISSLTGLDFTKKHADENPTLLAFKQVDFMRIRGFDERTDRADVIFMDLVARMLRSGSAVRRLGRKPFALDLNRMVSVCTAESSVTSVAEINKRKELVASDNSIYRNLISWSVPREHRSPLVSVAIATRNRCDYLRDSLHSIQNQSFEDWEVILVDDGSEDDTEGVVRSFDDSRIKYFRQPPTGISSARNLAADMSAGFYTAVHDDDDIMLPWRLETSLGKLSSDTHATYGSWVNFHNKTGEMALHITKNGFSKDLISFSGQTPGHATWLLPTSIIRELRYDETLTSSVDHNLAVRSIMSGLVWEHTGKVLFIRRIHDTQVSVTDSRRQKNAAILTRYASTFPMAAKAYAVSTESGKELKFPNPVDRSKLFETFGLYLPDHLVKRSLKISGLVGKKVLGLDIHDRFTHIIAEQDLFTDRSTLEVGGASDLIWEDLVRIRNRGYVGCQFKFTKRTDFDTLSGDEVGSPIDAISERVVQVLNEVRKLSPSGVLIQILAELENPSAFVDNDDVILARYLTLNYEPHKRNSRILLGFKNKKSAIDYLNGLDLSDNETNIVTPSIVDFNVIWNEFVGENQ